MRLLWPPFISAYYHHSLKCIRNVVQKCSSTFSSTTHNQSSSSDMAPKPEMGAVISTTNIAGRTKSVSQLDQTSSTKSKSVQGRKRKINNAKQSSPHIKLSSAGLRPAKPLKTKKSMTKNNIKRHSANASVIKPKTKSKEIWDPSGLETPPSTSSWDMYSDKMPENIAEALAERIEWWLYQIDTPEDYEDRCKRYGEDIASAFPYGGTPKYARMLEKAEREGKEEF